jgi:hypothetical protein
MEVEVTKKKSKRPKRRARKEKREENIVWVA